MCSSETNHCLFYSRMGKIQPILTQSVSITLVGMFYLKVDTHTLHYSTQDGSVLQELRYVQKLIGLRMSHQYGADIRTQEIGILGKEELSPYSVYRSEKPLFPCIQNVMVHLCDKCARNRLGRLRGRERPRAQASTVVDVLPSIVKSKHYIFTPKFQSISKKSLS